MTKGVKINIDKNKSIHFPSKIEFILRGIKMNVL